ncbi:thioredoxin-like fold domain-containing protein MRL7 homolog, chloroplastic [Papaver somniferum]|uniref:thioredoxin-like fold domain-containing protein MRL7 homolog, chloroplastic n=1 Tax=Papaver somniferum TaxID=3469 RepID=UPI000E700093|nr:thioredoxin-like fold domain-containing protein MRL7 homolog, chloroplastic [Papaver somniferum]XP_026423322.1 thioredoxin-like fold domain-containing protein MRL7 homolog, chloroplastic [Papaver somniferum]XP_026423323.1 thioredoxin-like fold domain-containing protein MRL7 homolog, chloroplastic [Papaver somniferum]XP_026423324.1 thioredoxin-like fold domain-containing protein MRL7 homolog, chloroplastic [Papaver somniferum]
MSLLQSPTLKPFLNPTSLISNTSYHLQIPNPSFHNPSLFFFSSSHLKHHKKSLTVSASDPKNSTNPSPKKKNVKQKIESKDDGVENQSDDVFPRTIPRKPRRGRKSEAVAVEDFVRDSLEKTFENIRKQSSDVFEEIKKVLKAKEVDDDDDEDDELDNDGKKKNKKKGEVVEEEDPNWPLDADVGWGTRASEYFDKHPIKNVVGEDGEEIDWEGEIDEGWVKEINCLEWESFAFHPSPLIVLVFERYNRASGNWKLLKELEKAAKVYWSAKDRLPPRTVKIDINIERDLAYALKVKECPQLLFLKGNKILYREKEMRTSEELVQMIAHFYYNAKKPACIDSANMAPPY